MDITPSINVPCVSIFEIDKSLFMVQVSVFQLWLEIGLTSVL